VASVTDFFMEDTKNKLLICWVCIFHLFSLIFYKLYLLIFHFQAYFFQYVCVAV
jgi:hypothetical protein